MTPSRLSICSSLDDARQCEIVELRFRGGPSIEETAMAVEVSSDTVKRDWSTAPVWLHRTITKSAILS
jgi:DNA-directed RNA polymerase specialized sigma24 family protein